MGSTPLSGAALAISWPRTREGAEQPRGWPTSRPNARGRGSRSNGGRFHWSRAGSTVGVGALAPAGHAVRGDADERTPCRRWANEVSNGCRRGSWMWRTRSGRAHGSLRITSVELRCATCGRCSCGEAVDPCRWPSMRSRSRRRSRPDPLDVRVDELGNRPARLADEVVVVFCLYCAQAARRRGAAPGQPGGLQLQRPVDRRPADVRPALCHLQEVVHRRGRSERRNVSRMTSRCSLRFRWFW